MTAPLRDPEILRRSLDLFRAVCDLETGEQLRSIQDACGSEPELRAAVEALLIADRAESDPLSDHAIDLAARDTTPDEIDGFKVVGVLGRGGMGIVYDAEQQHPRRRVAIKVIRPGSDSPTLRARIRREAEVLAMLRHPGIAQIHHAGEFAGSPYLVMERVDGVSLANATAKCDLRDRIGLIARIVDAVHHAHQRGIIHRDLKPDNILVNEEAPGRFQPKILDFGIARAADESLHATLADSLTIAEGGSLVGTLAYMSPEQIQGNREIDVRTDVYALGMIAHELLTGVKGKDLTGLSVVAAMRAAIENEPRPIGDIDPKLRGDIQTIIRKATETDRERRYQSAAEFAADLRRYLASEPITARPPSLGYLTGRLIARNKGVFAGVSVAVLALLAGLLVSLFAAASEHRQRSRSDRMLYAGSVSGAADALADHNPFRARQLLTIAPEELRGWEWDLLNTRLDPGQQLADTGLEFAVFGPGPDIGQSGPEILVAGAYEGRIRIGRLDADRFTPTHDLEPSAPLNHLSRFMFSPSGQTLFLTDLINNTVTQFDTRTGLETEHHTVSGLRPVGSFEPGEPVDGWVADGVACYRFGNAPRLARVVEHPQLGPVFAVYSQDRYDGQYMLGIVNAQTRRVLRRYPSDSQFGQNAWSHDGNRVYAINVSGWLRVFEPGEDTG
ncbi:MAG: serine/threonine protein kinase, partial [Phycisphaerales bacterium JB040]